jgi:hypothetical protein
MGSDRHYPEERPADVVRVRGSHWRTSGYAVHPIADQHNNLLRIADNPRLTFRAGSSGLETTPRCVLKQRANTGRDHYQAWFLRGRIAATAPKVVGTGGAVARGFIAGLLNAEGHRCTIREMKPHNRCCKSTSAAPQRVVTASSYWPPAAGPRPFATACAAGCVRRQGVTTMSAGSAA